MSEPETASSPTASSSGRLRTLLRSPELKKWIKYSCVSLVGVATTQIILALPYHSWGWSSVDANMFAVGISAIPAYLLNRAWVWGKRGSNSLTREVIPFWAFAIAGFLLSTYFVYLVEKHTHIRLADGRVVTANHVPKGDKQHESSWAVRAANLAGFGLLWVGRFFVLDKLLFKTNHQDEDTITRLAEDAPLA